MKADRMNRLLTACANGWLMVLIHLDAFCFAPLHYLKAAWWGLLGKRVRSRGQFAPLLGQSRRAYLLWGMRDERGRAHSTPGELPPIIALVDLTREDGATPERLEATRSSLAAEGVAAFEIGAGAAADLAAAAKAIDWAQGPWLLPVAAGDRLAPGAASLYREAIAGSSAQVVYADDDLLDRWGRFTVPHFKPDWNSELFEHFDYLAGACIVRGDAAALAQAGQEADWGSALVRAAAAGQRVAHIPKVLHHRQSRPVAPQKPVPLQVRSNLPAVSVIVPTRNRADLLRTCLDGVFASQYPDVEVIVVDNDSDDPETLAYLQELDPARAKVLRHSGPFNFSAINNAAAREARGELLCLLNNDIEVLAPDWLAILATQALRPDVGAVGAQLLYPDGRIQHAGVVIGVGNAAGHAHRFLEPDDEGYFRRHALPQFAAAVTAACLVVGRDKFMAVGGLDEKNFAVAYNDVDLCLRLNERGWQSLYEPRAVLVHHESVSRGFDRDPVGAARFAGELAALQRIWKTDQIVDRFHHPHLSRAAEQFSLAL